MNKIYFKNKIFKIISTSVVYFTIVSCGFMPSLKVQIDSEPKRNSRNLSIKLKTSQTVNSDGTKSSRGRPIKVCIYEIKRAGWFPSALLFGQGCSDQSNFSSTDASQVFNKIMAPNTSDLINLQISTEVPVKYLVSAEFSNIAIAKRTSQVTIDPGQNDLSLSWYFDSVIHREVEDEK